MKSWASCGANIKRALDIYLADVWPTSGSTADAENIVFNSVGSYDGLYIFVPWIIFIIIMSNGPSAIYSTTWILSAIFNEVLKKAIG